MSKLETKFVNDIAGKFFVKSYQRGYRWGKSEVERLLEDVFALKGHGGQATKNYCLQPIVVKNLGDENFELIDGQQRLTTIFLIYNYMHKASNGFFEEPNFSLDYETRDKSADFLANIDVARKDENIDFWFMANAYETIERWFAAKGQKSVVMGNLKNFFAYNVKVIWYEIDDTENATAMFTRLNIGKIPLTCAELVKAMFLSNENCNSDRRRDEIALQWDNLEKELHNDSLWYFLTNDATKKYQTRIDLILDLIAGKKIDNRDKYATFFYFDGLKKRGDDLNELWQKIVQTFLLLKDWHENHELYHKIGYLIASGYKNLSDIYAASKNKSKREFLSQLDELIKASIKLKVDENYSAWNYTEDAERIRRLLLLFNVESVRQNGEQSQWFPFDKYKFGDEKNSWSLEHIHAVNSQEVGKQEQWREWLKLHRASLENFPDDNKTLLDEIDKLLKISEIKGEKFRALQKKILDKLSPESMSESTIDSIANLALLKCENNSALGNSVFDVKRNEIINLDMHGAFIPFCTKMAFLKYYTKSEQTQIHFWSATDRREYIRAINFVLKDFLSEPIKFADKEN
ncbi:MAG: DUF262 domain-containing protein [Selenomonadaceae bacterium]|nr:DUF262 domain-containing protein [Selenomonadaceae bacterium]